MTLPTCLIEAQQVAAEAEHKVDNVHAEASCGSTLHLRANGIILQVYGDHVRTGGFLLLLCD